MNCKYCGSENEKQLKIEVYLEQCELLFDSFLTFIHLIIGIPSSRKFSLYKLKNSQKLTFIQ